MKKSIFKAPQHIATVKTNGKKSREQRKKNRKKRRKPKKKLRTKRKKLSKIKARTEER